MSYPDGKISKRNEHERVLSFIQPTWTQGYRGPGTVQALFTTVNKTASPGVMGLTWGRGRGRGKSEQINDTQ